MKNIFTYVIIIALILTNLMSIWFIVKKGVTVNKTYNIENHQHQNQQQSMVVMSDTRAKNITWKLIDTRELCKMTGMQWSMSEYPNIVTAYFSTLTPWQVDMAKVFPYPQCAVMIPVEEVSK